MRRRTAIVVMCLVLAGVVLPSLWLSRHTSIDTAWFQKTEQALMDAIAVGDKQIWNRVLDDRFIYTTEEGQVLTKQDLLRTLSGLPAGLTGSITVEELTVQKFTMFAVVRFLANEQETVFGQVLRTKYRNTDTFARVRSEWKLIASHQSVVTADPPPQSVPTETWPRLAGDYKLMPNGWAFHVGLREGNLFGGRDPNQLAPLIPIGSNVFVRKGTLGELIFVDDKDGNVAHLVELRKFQPLIWTRVPPKGDRP